MKINFRLNDAQLKQMSDIAANLSVLFFGTAIVTPLLTSVDSIKPGVVVWGSIAALILLLQSLLFLRGIKS